MKARTPQEMYNGAVDILEEMLKDDYRSDHSATTDIKTMDGFIHCLCGLMKTAFAHGINGDAEPGFITELKSMNEPIMSATATLLEFAYTAGIKARG